jgi:hypothetical protein
MGIALDNIYRQPLLAWVIGTLIAGGFYLFVCGLVLQLNARRRPEPPQPRREPKPPQKSAIWQPVPATVSPPPDSFEGLAITDVIDELNW